jgi:hypothetical protein
MAIHKYTVLEANNINLGQSGSIFTDASDSAIKPPDGKAFVAIQFLAATTFDSSGGLVAENSTFYPSTEASAHDATGGSETYQEGSGGKQIDVNNSFPAGSTIYGRWTEIDLASGSIIAYIG